MIFPQQERGLVTRLEKSFEKVYISDQIGMQTAFTDCPISYMDKRLILDIRVKSSPSPYE